MESKESMNIEKEMGAPKKGNNEHPLSRRAPFPAVNTAGWTPLHAAAAGGQTQIIRALLLVRAFGFVWRLIFLCFVSFFLF